MIKILVDTDILIDYLRTGKGTLPDLLKLQAHKQVGLHMSAITILEIFAGRSSKKLTSMLHQLISGFKVMHLTSELARFTGELKRDNNLPTAFSDLIIGATALSIKAKLATRNRHHFQAIPKLKFYSTFAKYPYH